MDQQAEMPLSERKVARRGLMAAIAALGAGAMMHVKGAGKAEAAPDLALNDITNAPTSETRLTTNPAAGFAQAVFQVLNGGTPVTGVKTALTGISTAGHALYAQSDTNQAILARRTGTGGVGGATILARTRHVDGVALSGIADNNDGDGFGFGTGVSGRSYEGIGVQGASERGVAVRGRIGQAGANVGTIGVFGTATDTSGVGVKGIGQGNGTGVRGISNLSTFDATDAANGNGVGVQGRSGNGPGVEGISTNGLGVRGQSTSSVAMVGISTGNHGLYGSTSSAGAAGFVGENLAGGLAGYFAGNVMITGSLQVVGAKNAVIKMQDGTSASVYCQESPEPYFEDFGRAQLVGGVANVTLEREFAQLVAGGHYHVFTEPEGDTRGLFVSRRSATGFEVRECQGGMGSFSFSYRIVTKRKDIEGRRFARVNDEVGKNLAAVRALLGVTSTSPTNAPSPGPLAPLPFVPPASGPAPAPPASSKPPATQPTAQPPQTPGGPITGSIARP